MSITYKHYFKSHHIQLETLNTLYIKSVTQDGIVTGDPMDLR